MRLLLALFGSALLVGCVPEPEREAPPPPLTLDELAVEVDSAARGFFLSDRAGGFLTGAVRPGALGLDLSWGAERGEILRGLALAGGARTEAARAVVRGRITPAHIWCSLEGGSELEVEPLETGPGVHALALEVTNPSEAIVPAFPPPPGFTRPRPLAQGDGLLWSGRSGALVLYGGVPLDGGRLVLPAGGPHRLLLCYAAEARTAETAARDLFGRLEAMRRERRARLTALLNQASLRMSDSLVARAANWFMLSLDALIVQGRDTLLAPGAPWDGTYDLRAAAQTMSGLELATAGESVAPALLRVASRLQDTLATSPTRGRIPWRISPSGARFDAADVTAWMIREQYEHIARSADTALVHQLYPVARRSLEAAYEGSVDRRGLLRHGAHETWMAVSDDTERGRADRAVEVQTFWYYEQMIGSFLAAFLGQTEESNRWAGRGETTQVAITQLYMDTTAVRIADHLRADGRAVQDETPNGLLAFELTPSELFRQELIESLVPTLATPYGVKTGPGGVAWPWLGGQIVYVLSRYDRQDLSYQMTGQLAREAMERGMVGVLAEFYQWPAAQAGGLPVYGPSMGEFLRALYQDYFGVTIDALSRQISLMPKLPPQISWVDATVRVGRSRVRVRYEIGRESSRAVLTRSGGERDLNVGFIWMLPDGNAWRGSAPLGADGELRLIFSADDVVAYRDGAEQEIVGKWNLQAFSRRGELRGLRLVGSSAP